MTGVIAAVAAAVLVLAAAVAIFTFVPPLVTRRADESALRNRARGRLVLTYDDGPGTRLTPTLLELLARYDARATFFLVGFRAESNPEMVERTIAGGHDLGSHTHWHKNAWKKPIFTIGDVRRGYESTARWMPGDAPFRAPFGKLTTWMSLALRRRGAPIVWWTCDALDQTENRPPAGQVAGQIADEGGGVVLMHSHDSGLDREAYVLEVTEAVLRTARERGLEVCTVSDLLGAGPDG